jgi:transposase
MTNYREILRLHSLGFSQQNIALSCSASKKTVNKVLQKAAELNISWPLPEMQSNPELAKLMFPKHQQATQKRLPNMDFIHKELLRNGVSKKLLWTEYLEECRQLKASPLMYSQFCYHIQQDEQRRRATMHISRKPGEQVEVDWAGDKAHLIDPVTGELIDAYLFVGVMTYSQYAYGEVFLDQKQQAWITANNNMLQYFGGVPKIIVPDNCKTAVIAHGKWDDPRLNKNYQELAEHYGTAIIPARIRSPKDKPNAEGTVRHVSTWVTAALRNEQFFSLAELNQAVKERMETFNRMPFQKKEGSRLEIFRDEELPLLAHLPAAPYELAEWKKLTVQFNYHISCDGMLYSVPYEYIKKQVDIRETDKVVEIFYGSQRIASHVRLYGRKGQYSTVVEHMPESHQKYIAWNGKRFLDWSKKIGPATNKAISAILASHPIEQQAYRSCMGVLKLSERYSNELLEKACEKALFFSSVPSYKSIRNILVVSAKKLIPNGKREKTVEKDYGITRGASYYRRQGK